jgi:hypothetical protein
MARVADPPDRPKVFPNCTAARSATRTRPSVDSRSGTIALPRAWLHPEPSPSLGRSASPDRRVQPRARAGRLCARGSGLREPPASHAPRHLGGSQVAAAPCRRGAPSRERSNGQCVRLKDSTSGNGRGVAQRETAFGRHGLRLRATHDPLRNQRRLRGLRHSGACAQRDRGHVGPLGSRSRPRLVRHRHLGSKRLRDRDAERALREPSGHEPGRGISTRCLRWVPRRLRERPGITGQPSRSSGLDRARQREGTSLPR